MHSAPWAPPAGLPHWSPCHPDRLKETKGVGGLPASFGTGFQTSQHGGGGITCAELCAHVPRILRLKGLVVIVLRSRRVLRVASMPWLAGTSMSTSGCASCPDTATFRRERACPRAHREDDESTAWRPIVTVCGVSNLETCGRRRSISSSLTSFKRAWCGRCNKQGSPHSGQFSMVSAAHLLPEP